jgi:predicted nucleic acid-binding Zn finger protein
MVCDCTDLYGDVDRMGMEDLMHVIAHDQAVDHDLCLYITLCVYEISYPIYCLYLNDWLETVPEKNIIFNDRNIIN